MKESYESGESVAVSCKDGYEQAGVNTSVCGYKHQWDDFSYIDRAHGYGSFDPDINYHTCKSEYSYGREIKIQPVLATANCT